MSQRQKSNQIQYQTKDWRYLRRCLLAEDLYQHTSYFLDQIRLDNLENILIVLNTLSQLLEDSEEDPSTRLRALRFLRECMDINSGPFKIELGKATILDQLLTLTNKSNPNEILIDNPTIEQSDISWCFYTLAFECIIIWGKWYSIDQQGGLSIFSKTHMKSKHQQLAVSKLKFFKISEIYKFEDLGEKISTLVKAANNDFVFIDNLPASQQIDSLQTLNLIVSDLYNYQEEINILSKDIHLSSNERDQIAKVAALLVRLEPTIRGYLEQKMSYTDMVSILKGFIQDRDHLISLQDLSNFGIQRNSLNWFERGTIGVIIEKMKSQGNKSSMKKNQQANQDNLNKLSESELFRQVNNAHKDSFDFGKEGEMEEKQKRINDLEREREELASEVLKLREEKKKAETALDNKQDELDLTIQKNNYFSYPKEYSDLLIKFQVLELEHDKINHQLQLVNEENEKIKKENEEIVNQKDMLSEMLNNQKDIIQSMNVKLNSLKEQIKEEHHSKQAFKQDCERKYAINSLLSGQGNQQDSFERSQQKFNSLYLSNNLNASLNSSTLRQFKPKDFMRGQIMNESNFELLRQIDGEGISYAFKLGCLKQSVILLDNELMKIHFKMENQRNDSQSKNGDQSQQLFDQFDEIEEIQEENESAQIFQEVKYNMMITVSIFNKCNYPYNLQLTAITNSPTIQVMSAFDIDPEKINPQETLKYEIRFEVNQIPFVQPILSIQMSSYAQRKLMKLPLPISILNLIEWDSDMLHDRINNLIGTWTVIPDSSIMRTQAFTVDKQLLQRNNSILQLLPSLFEVPSNSLNILELIAKAKLRTNSSFPFVLKVSMMNDRFLTLQGKVLTQPPFASQHLMQLGVILNTLKHLFSNSQS